MNLPGRGHPREAAIRPCSSGFGHANAAEWTWRGGEWQTSRFEFPHNIADGFRGRAVSVDDAMCQAWFPCQPNARELVSSGDEGKPFGAARAISDLQPSFYDLKRCMQIDRQSRWVEIAKDAVDEGICTTGKAVLQDSRLVSKLADVTAIADDGASFRESRRDHGAMNFEKITQKDETLTQRTGRYEVRSLAHRRLEGTAESGATELWCDPAAESVAQEVSDSSFPGRLYPVDRDPTSNLSIRHIGAPVRVGLRGRAGRSQGFGDRCIQ